MAKLTPSQTIGPYFHEGMQWAVAPAATAAGAVNVAGRVLDRDGKPVGDAVLEVWQPGWSAAPFQRVYTSDAGAFAFAMPQPVAGQQHANVTVFARGLTNGLFTRVYLHAADDPAKVQLPPGVPRERAGTLIARRDAKGTYQWDVRLQGEGETVFFEL
jgi:protocatechuate 3,4-dioxygenase alpha subunit